MLWEWKRRDAVPDLDLPETKNSKVQERKIQAVFLLPDENRREAGLHGRDRKAHSLWNDHWAPSNCRIDIKTLSRSEWLPLCQWPCCFSSPQPLLQQASWLIHMAVDPSRQASEAAAHHVSDSSLGPWTQRSFSTGPQKARAVTSLPEASSVWGWIESRL